MKCNMHPVERLTRIGVGLAICLLAFIGPENKWYLLGAIPLITGLIGFCPPYAIFGINTCELDKKKEDKK